MPNTWKPAGMSWGQYDRLKRDAPTFCQLLDLVENRNTKTLVLLTKAGFTVAWCNVELDGKAGHKGLAKGLALRRDTKKKTGWEAYLMVTERNQIFITKQSKNLHREALDLVNFSILPGCMRLGFNESDQFSLTYWLEKNRYEVSLLPGDELWTIGPDTNTSYTPYTESTL